MAVDIDGTLRNPIVTAALILFTLLLSGAAYLITIRQFARGSRRRRFLPAGALVLALALANGPVVRTLVASYIKATSTFHGSVGVGFFGHHPLWITPLAILAAAFMGFVRQRTRGTGETAVA